MAKFTVVLQDETGAVQTGLNVDLYEGDGSGAKYGDFSENADGSYSITVSTSGIYTVKVGGTIETELQSIYIPVEDIDSRLDDLQTEVDAVEAALTTHKTSSDHDGRYYTEAEIDVLLDQQATLMAGDGLVTSGVQLAVNPDNVGIEISGDQVRLKDDGVTAAKINANVAGDGLVQDTDGSLKVSVDTESIVISVGNQLELMDGGVRPEKLSPLVAGDGLVQDVDGSLNVGVGDGLDVSETAIYIPDEGITDRFIQLSFLDRLSLYNLLFGYAGSITGSMNTILHTVDGAQNNEGYLILRGGYIKSIGITMVNNLEGFDNVSIRVEKNGSTVETVNVTVGNGSYKYQAMTGARGIAVEVFDRVRIQASCTSIGGNISNIAINLEMVNQNFTD